MLRYQYLYVEGQKSIKLLKRVKHWIY